MGKIKNIGIPQCLNCGSELEPADKYCAKCGQRAKGAKVPLRDFIGDFFQDYFTVDSKFFRSILWLLARPGKLTKEFNEGKRKSYIAPLRMYLFTSFIYFFLLSLSVKNDTQEWGLLANKDKHEKALILDSLLISDADTIAMADIRALVDSLHSSPDLGSVFSIDKEEVEEDGMSEYLQNQAEKVNENPEALIRSVFRVASISLFFLLPLFALVLWLFHFKRNRFYVQHLVHALHLHTFGFALMSIYISLSFWVDSHSFKLIPLIILIYLVWSLKVVYGQRIFPAITKGFGVVMVYTVMLFLAMISVLFVAFFTV